MLNGQIAQAMLRSDGEVRQPHLQVPLRERMIVLPDLSGERHVSLSSPFGEWQGATVLCACGCLARLDRATVHRRRMMGKPVECRACRNRRVALEKEDLDSEFYGLLEE